MSSSSKTSKSKWKWGKICGEVQTFVICLDGLSPPWDPYLWLWRVWILILVTLATAECCKLVFNLKDGHTLETRHRKDSGDSKAPTRPPNLFLPSFAGDDDCGETSSSSLTEEFGEEINCKGWSLKYVAPGSSSSSLACIESFWSLNMWSSSSSSSASSLFPFRRSFFFFWRRNIRMLNHRPESSRGWWQLKRMQLHNSTHYLFQLTEFS